MLGNLIMIVSLSTELARSCLPVSLRHKETQYPNFIIPFITENGRPQRFPIVFYIKAHRYDAIKYACKITFSKIFVDLDTFLIDFLAVSLFHSLFLYNIIVASISLRRDYVVGTAFWIFLEWQNGVISESQTLMNEICVKIIVILM